MKTILRYLIVPGLVAFLSLTGHAQSVKEAVKKYKPKLGWYNYDGFTSSDIVAGKKEKKLEYEFTAFNGVSYRILFCQVGLKTPVVIKIYDKNLKSKTRNLVFDNSADLNKPFWVFEPEHNGTYYIEYLVPAVAQGEKNKGSVVMLLGANVKGSETTRK